ncbi:Hypothetical protein NTJ_01765 [Nesidiocoris tenuis]|uniref:Uncharacterized protein n=1 Tax=Nesidiocoris tenuis TaxID=355587 RepID=A0ABN7AAD7_9HEMI|nr:Hypothetical protein NTJ_01765 [Nesidiocoris tenuis]
MLTFEAYNGDFKLHRVSCSNKKVNGLQILITCFEHEAKKPLQIFGPQSKDSRCVLYESTQSPNEKEMKREMERPDRPNRKKTKVEAGGGSVPLRRTGGMSEPVSSEQGTAVGRERWEINENEKFEEDGK